MSLFLYCVMVRRRDWWDLFLTNLGTALNRSKPEAIAFGVGHGRSLFDQTAHEDTLCHVEPVIGLLSPLGLVARAKFSAVTFREAEARIIRRIPWYVAEGGERQCLDATTLARKGVEQACAEARTRMCRMNRHLFRVCTAIMIGPIEKADRPIVSFRHDDQQSTLSRPRLEMRNRRRLVGRDLRHSNRDKQLARRPLDILKASRFVTPYAANEIVGHFPYTIAGARCAVAANA